MPAAPKQASQQAQSQAKKLFAELKKSLTSQSGMVRIVVEGATILCNQTVPGKKINTLLVPEARALIEGRKQAAIQDNERDKHIKPWQAKCKMRPDGKGDYLPCDYQPASVWAPGVQTGKCSDMSAGFPNSDIALQAMTDMMEDGYSATQSAGMMGNILQESDFFRADSEYGTGVGRGWIQWSYSRRSEFEAWSSAKGLDPTSYNANYDYLMAEMQGQGWGDLNHWSGNGLDGFKSQTDLDGATRYFENNFERASKPHMDRRMKRARKAKRALETLKDLAIPEVALLRCNYKGIISVAHPGQETKKANIGSCVAHMPRSVK